MRRKGSQAIRIAMGVVVLAAALAPSSAGASYYEEGVSFTTQIEREGVTYRMQVRAVETMGYSHRLDLTISRVEDPDGVARLRQRQTWSYDLEPDDLTREGDGYRIDAGAEDGPYRVDVHVGPRDSEACSARQGWFVTQPEGGAFRIETDNAVFGIITELPQCGRHWYYTSGPMPGRPCPRRGVEMRSPVLQATERRADGHARVAISLAEERPIAGQNVRWLLTFRGTLPEDRVAFDRRLRGSIRGDGIAWLSGTATFRPSGPARTEDWYDCRGGREARTVSRPGSLGGDLTLDVIGYEDEKLTAPEAWAALSRVRPRS